MTLHKGICAALLAVLLFVGFTTSRAEARTSPMWRSGRIAFAPLSLGASLGPALAATGQRSREFQSDTTEKGVVERFFEGSYVGSKIFGTPYTRTGMADMVLMALFFYMGLKIMRIMNKNRQAGPDNQQGERGPDRYGSLDKEQGGQTGWPDRTKDADTRGGWPAPSSDRSKGPWDDAADRPNPSDSADGRQNANKPKRMPTVKEQAASAWQYLRNAPPSQNVPEPDLPGDGMAVPADFDSKDFLDGARLLYNRLQMSWAAREVDDIAPFVSPAMLNMVREQAKNDPHPKKVEVVYVNATLSKVSRMADAEMAEVVFNALLREEGAPNPMETRELWHFVRGLGPGSMWQLDAIEQVGSS